MYGLLLQSIVEAMRTQFGEDLWREIKEVANLDDDVFDAFQMYDEDIVGRLTTSALELSAKYATPDEIMNQCGRHFVSFVGSHINYQRILPVLGRNLRDFLNGLDNLHEYVRPQYPHMSPPSFFCEQESSSGLVLRYRSRRRGFEHYVAGQIVQIATEYYNTALDIELGCITEQSDGVLEALLHLKFDNTAFVEQTQSPDAFQNADVTISSESFLEAFPFHVLLDGEMVIRSIGCGLTAVLPSIVGQRLTDVFRIKRPLVELTLANVLTYTNNVFELHTIEPIQPPTQNSDILTDNDSSESSCRILKLKGQMLYVDEWQSVIYLSTPTMTTLKKLCELGLYLNDLSLHDSSRDLILSEFQQAAELKQNLDQEQMKNRKLEESMRELDVEMERTNMLLYQMIPKSVADRLRRGEQTASTCQVFDNVTILFSDVVGFTYICSLISPMAVVSMLNEVYTQFDQLSEKYNVYKVETIGDAYMLVSGAPNVTLEHAEHICDMAFEMVDAMSGLTDPSTGTNMRIRIGIHSGSVVAGVIGLKMSRYCLFGETVNTASLMETGGEAMKIHISEITKNHLDRSSTFDYLVEERGSVDIKDYGCIKTFWLVGKKAKGQVTPSE